MKVLMFGWEFPPFKTGGLGTACYDLTKGLSRQDIDITFVMPYAPEDAGSDFVNIKSAHRKTKNIKVRKVNSILAPYQTYEQYDDSFHKIKVNRKKSKQEIYGKDIYEEVYRYSIAAKEIAQEEDFEVIHVHDWMTYEAGINAKKISDKPLIAHIHATEYDRTGGNPNSYIADIEKKGLERSDIIIANSNFTKNNVITCYGIDPKKIEVVHWGIDPDNKDYSQKAEYPDKNEKLVLFLGRMTLQKGPDYFVEAANKVLKHEKDVKFVMAGSGDMFSRVVEKVAEYGIADRFIFTGFLQGKEVHKAFKMADLYVMPSVSEPFGLVALESIKNNTPILISRQSGVSEVVNHALKADFWDVDEMTNKIVSLLRYSELHEELKVNSFKESKKFNLDDPAKKCIDIYRRLA